MEVRNKDITLFAYVIVVSSSLTSASSHMSFAQMVQGLDVRPLGMERC
jgi:hypothetical protein